MASFRETLSQLKVSDLNIVQNVVEIKSSSSLEEGFEQLVSANVLSAPVWDEATKKYTGFLDMRDLVSAVVFIADSAATPSTKSLADLFVNAKYTGGSFTTTYFSRRNAFKPVTADTTLLEVVGQLSVGGPGKVKRLPVVGADGKVTAIISQSTVLSFLQKNLLEHPLSASTVKELHIGTSPVLGVVAAQPAIEAFRMMDRANLTGLAIVDNSGKLVGNVSSRDLKVFIRNINFDALQMPIGEFVKELRKMSVDIKAPTITLFDTHTYAFAVSRLSATKVHRVFVVDDEESFKPTSVISLVDILTIAVKE